MGTICALVIGVYAWNAKSGCWELSGADAGDSYYNLLVQGFRSGQLSVKRDVPPGLAQLADPYDPKANSPYLMNGGRLLYDLSYYQGKLHLYFGVTPAVLLFWPWQVLTSNYLLHRDAGVIFCVAGFLACMGLLWAAWHRHFAGVGIGLVGVCTLVLGLTSGALLLLVPCDVYNVAVSCGYALWMLALVAIWQALHSKRWRSWWLAGASLAYGLALGARPSLLFGAATLLVPVITTWREQAESGQRSRLWILLLAATGPITLIGLGLMCYNDLRFGNPFEFGWHYQLSGYRQDTMRPLGLDHLWFNFRVYFLEPARWSLRFPFVHDITMPPSTAGPAKMIEHPFGIGSNTPIVWLALVTPLAWLGRLQTSRGALRGFAVTLAIQFGICAMTLSLFHAACLRYEAEFLSALVWLAVLGILELERTLAARPAWRHAARSGWSLLLAFSLAFNLFAIFERYADTHMMLGVMLTARGQAEAARSQFQKALKLQPDNPRAHNNFGVELLREGKVLESIKHQEEALRLKPDFATAHNDLGTALFQQGRVAEAIEHYQQAVRIKPDFDIAQNNLRAILFRSGKLAEAVARLEQALRVQPENSLAHTNLVEALCQLGEGLTAEGKWDEAAAKYERAVELNPEDVQALHSLAVTLCHVGRFPEAISHLGQALRLKPDLAEAHRDLGFALLQVGRLSEAQAELEQAIRLKSQDPETLHNNLGLVLLRQGKAAEAIPHFELALQINPNFTEAHNNFGIALFRVGQVLEAVGHLEKAAELNPEDVGAHTSLAWILATCADESVRNGTRAVEHAELANRLSGGNDPGILDTLAAAYAEAGRFGQAVQTAEAGLELTRRTGQEEQARRLRERLQLYQAGQPYREGTVSKH